MSKQTLLAATFSILPLGAALAAEPASLSGDELREAVSGKTVYLNISGFELPICYSPNGSMAGSMGVVAASLAQGDSACGSPVISSANAGRAGWTESPIAYAHAPGQKRALVAQ